MTELRRSLNLTLLTLYGLGTILGAGIYVLIGKVAGTSGMFTPWAFLLAAAVAGLSGYCYAALCSRYPQSAGEAAYVQAALGLKPLSTLVGWLVILTGLISAATISNGFVGYINLFVEISSFWAITLLLILMGGLASWGVSQSVIAATVVTLLEIGGLFLVIFVAGGSLGDLPQRLPEMIPTLSQGEAWAGIALGAFLAFYAFIGFEDMVNMAEEVKEPESTIPKAIIIALAVSTLLYVLIALIAMMALPLAELQQSDAPMADILSSHNANASTLISLISLVAITNGALVQIIMGARVLYGMGRQGLAPSWLSYVHPKLQTPVVATALVTLVIWLFAIALPLTTLAKITSFIIIVVFLLMDISLAVILHREKQTGTPPKASQVAIWVPVLAAFLCVALLLLQFL